MAIERIFPMRFNRRGYNIVIVGAGGTGGYLANYVAKSVALINSSRQRHHHIVSIVDGDTVENKNITRQNFIPADIGRNKAEVLAERYGNAYGIEMLYVPSLVTTKTKLKQIFKFAADRQQQKNNASSNYDRYSYYNQSEPLIPILIGCVDSNKTRGSVFHEFFFEQDEAIWIDCGNEKTNGQTIIGVKTMYAQDWSSEENLNNKYKTYKDLMKHGQQHRAMFAFNTPTVTQLHPDILENLTKESSEIHISCADAALVDPQTMRANLHAATLAYHYVDDLLYNREISSHAVYFSTNGSTAPKLNTFNSLKAYN